MNTQKSEERLQTRETQEENVNSGFKLNLRAECFHTSLCLTSAWKKIFYLPGVWKYCSVFYVLTQKSCINLYLQIKKRLLLKRQKHGGRRSALQKSEHDLFVEHESAE